MSHDFDEIDFRINNYVNIPSGESKQKFEFVHDYETKYMRGRNSFRKLDEWRGREGIHSINYDKNHIVEVDVKDFENMIGFKVGGVFGGCIDIEGDSTAVDLLMKDVREFFNWYHRYLNDNLTGDEWQALKY